jgi:hypothetical protein
MLRGGLGPLLSVKGGVGRVVDRGQWRDSDSLLERARLDATTSVAGGGNARGAVLDLLAVAAERGVAAVEDGRLLGVLGPASPVPVLWCC